MARTKQLIPKKRSNLKNGKKFGVRKKTSGVDTVKCSGQKSEIPKEFLKKPSPGMKVIREIKKFQQSTSLLLNKTGFYWLVREVLRRYSTDSGGSFRIQESAVTALQEAAEAYLVEILHDANLCALHGRRVTLTIRDMKLAMRLKGMLL